MSLMDWILDHLGRPPTPPPEGPDPMVEHSRREREAAEHRVRSLEAQVRVTTGDYDWRARRGETGGHDAGHP